MTRGITGNAPIYEDLVRELGDVVAEAQRAADHIEHQAADLLARRPAHCPAFPQEGGTQQ
jgi:hypothetical protein